MVKEEVGSRVVETWFKAIQFCRFDAHNKTAYLQAPNNFVQEWVSSHYLALFEQHLGRLLHESSIHIVFIQQQDQVKPATAPLIPAVKAPVVRQRSSMNHLYQFNNFVVGPHNSLAYAAAHAITEKPGRLYNPFFIYGPSGLGKTHLLHAIGNALKQQGQHKILYQGADRFVHEFINAIRFDKVYQFEAKYKDVDLLLIDDIQFLSNKEQTQEAFFHIFNTLHQAQKQLVFTSDSLPSDIAGLANRMRSRLESGLIADISVPTLETKIAIIKKKAEQHNEIIDDGVAEYIARNVNSNVRELEGALIRVCACASLTKQPLTLELVQKVLVHTKETQATPADLPTIATQVAQYFDYTLHDLKSTKRDKDIILARHMSIYFMKQMTRHSLREIGKFLERKDHSTVMHALDKIEEKKSTDPAFAQLLTRVERRLNSP